MGSEFLFNNKAQENLGKIDFTKIKSGLKKEDISSSNELVKSLFDMLDKNSDGTLNREEILNLEQLLTEIDKDGNNEISDKEASKLKNSEGKKLGKKNIGAFWDLLSTIVQKSESEGVVNVTESNEAGEIITYNDGRVERRLNTGLVETINKNRDEEIFSIHDQNGNIVFESIINENSAKVTTYDKNGNAYVNEFGDEHVATQGNTTAIYRGGVTIIKNDDRVTKEKFNENNIITYLEDGTKILEISSENGKSYISFDNNNEIISELIYTDNEDGSRNLVRTDYDLHGNQVVSTERLVRNSSTLLEQKYISTEGHEITLTYDQNGNTSGVIVQYGETIVDIARTFGVNKEELLSFNRDKVKGSGNNIYFEVGESITIPKTIMADSENIVVRNSAEEEVAKYELAKLQKEMEAQLAEAEALQKSLYALESQRQKRTETIRYTKPLYVEFKNRGIGNDGITSRGYKILGNLTKENVVEFYQLSSGWFMKYYDVHHTAFDNILENLIERALDCGAPKDLLDTYKTAYYETKKGYTTSGASIKDIFDKLVAIINSYEIYLSSYEIKKLKEDTSDEDFKNAQKCVVEMYSKWIECAEKLFEEQLDKDGFCADIADGVSGWFGSENTADEVREDLETANNDLKRLRACENIEDFNREYERIFGIKFDITLFYAAVKKNAAIEQAVSRVEQLDAEIEEQKHFVGQEIYKQEKQDSYNGILNVFTTSGLGVQLPGRILGNMLFYGALKKNAEIEQSVSRVEELDAEIEELEHFVGEEIYRQEQHDFYGGIHNAYYPTLEMRLDDYYNPGKCKGYSIEDRNDNQGKMYSYVSPKYFEDDLIEGILYLIKAGVISRSEISSSYFPTREEYLNFKGDITSTTYYVDSLLKCLYIQKQDERNSLLGGLNKRQAEFDIQNTLTGMMGVKDSIVTRVLEYNLSQDVGAEVVKGSIIAGGTFFTALFAPIFSVGFALLGGFIIEFFDSATTGAALENLRSGDFEGFAEETWNQFDLETVLTNTVINAVSMGMGIFVAKSAAIAVQSMQVSSKLLQALTQALIELQADIVLGIATDIIVNGEVTIEGVVYNVAFSVAGNSISMVSCKPKTKNIKQNPNGYVDLNTYINNKYRGAGISEVNISSLTVDVPTDKSTPIGRRTVEFTTTGGNKLNVPEFSKTDIERLLSVLYIKGEKITDTDVVLIKNYVDNLTSLDDLLSIEALLKQFEMDDSVQRPITEAINKKQIALEAEMKMGGAAADSYVDKHFPEAASLVDVETNSSVKPEMPKADDSQTLTIEIKDTGASKTDDYIEIEENDGTFDVREDGNASESNNKQLTKPSEVDGTIVFNNLKLEKTAQKLQNAGYSKSAIYRMKDLDDVFKALNDNPNIPDGAKELSNKLLSNAKKLDDIVKLEIFIDAVNEIYDVYGSILTWDDKTDFASRNQRRTSTESYNLKIDDLNTENDPNEGYIEADLNNAYRTENAKIFIKKYANTPEAEFLYQKYLETRFDSENKIERKNKQKLAEINKKYGVRVFLPEALKGENNTKYLDAIEKELTTWKKYGKTNAKLPPVINLSTIADSRWYDGSGVKGSSETANGAIRFKTFEDLNVHIRHEMTHSNDESIHSNKQGPTEERIKQVLPQKTVLKNGKQVSVPDLGKSPYVNEMLKVGIPRNLINYAHTSRAEFIAVAATGDMELYSPEFKAVLVEFGMPEWQLEMPYPREMYDGPFLKGIEGAEAGNGTGTTFGETEPVVKSNSQNDVRVDETAVPNDMIEQTEYLSKQQEAGASKTARAQMTELNTNVKVETTTSKVNTNTDNANLKISEDVLKRGTKCLASEGTPEATEIENIVKESAVIIKTKEEALSLFKKQYDNNWNKDAILILNPSNSEKANNGISGTSNSYMCDWYAEANGLDKNNICNRENIKSLIESKKEQGCKKVIIVVPDDFAGSGRSMIVDTATAINDLNLGDDIQIQLVYSPLLATPMAKTGFDHTVSMNLSDLQNDNILSVGGKVSDIDIMTRFFDNCKQHNIEITFSNEIIEVLPYYQTPTFQNLKSTNEVLAGAVETILTNYGTRKGYGREGSFGTIVIVPGNDGRLKTPNNNTYGAAPYALASGVPPEKIKRPDSKIQVKKWINQMKKISADIGVNNK